MGTGSLTHLHSLGHDHANVVGKGISQMPASKQMHGYALLENPKIAG